MILAALLTLSIATSADGGILAFADAFDRAQLTQDAAALNEMVADELVFIDGSGKRLGKKDFIAGWTAPGDRFDPVVLTDRKVIALGDDAAIVNAETILGGTSGGQRFATRIRFADTFRRVGGKWRAVHIQVTPIR
jgi:ketosteroid isomerase-like protein